MMNQSSRPAIIALSDTRWHLPWWMSRQQLMSRLARDGWPVLYANGPLSTWDRGSGLWNKSSLVGRTESVPTGGRYDVLLEYPPWLIAARGSSSAWTGFVNRRYAKRLRKLASRLSGESWVLFLTDPRLLPVAELVGWRKLVLYVNDQWRRLDGWTARSDRLLERSVDAADLIICVADSMARDLPGKGAEVARILPHGVDAQSFEDCEAGECPADIAAIPHPRIMYVGRISKKVDLDLVHEIARRRPDWHWIFVGAAGIGMAEHSSERRALEAMRALPNVHLLGVRPREAVPAYVAHADVNAICFRTTEEGFWGGTAPTKLWEYFAAGKPIVSTPLENVLPWAGSVRIATTADEWIVQISEALAQPASEYREAMRAIARQNTWDHRANQLSDWLTETIGADSTGR